MTTAVTAVLLSTGGFVVAIDLPNNSEERQAVYRAVLRCAVYDVVDVTNRLSMWIDDEGLYNHAPNPYATALAQRYGLTSQRYHGPVLLTGGVDKTGETLPLTTDQVRALLTSLDEHP